MQFLSGLNEPFDFLLFLRDPHPYLYKERFKTLEMVEYFEVIYLYLITFVRGSS